MIELGNIKNDILSTIKDPFNKDCIKDIDIHITTSWSTPPKRYCWATVTFQNGNTKGEQRFGNHDDFKTLMTEVQVFMDELEK